MPSTSVLIDDKTHQALKRLAEQLGTTEAGAVAMAVRRFQQDRIGTELRAPVNYGDLSWLNADLG